MQKRASDASDLKALERLASEKSSDKRRELMSRLTDFLVIEVDAYPDETVRLLGDTLITLLDQLDENCREELSERVAPHETTPHGLVKRLATDTSARVAKPVLSKSPVLTDDDLVEIASNHSEAHLLSMAERTRLSTKVTDAMIDHGTPSVFEAVAENLGAEISEEGFSRLAETSSTSIGLAEALGRRVDLPETVAEKVISSLPTDYQIRLKQLWLRDVPRSEALLDEAALQFRHAKLAGKRGMLEAKVAANAITSGTRSLDSAINEFAGSNRPSETAFVISVLISTEK